MLPEQLLAQSIYLWVNKTFSDHLTRKWSFLECNSLPFLYCASQGDIKDLVRLRYILIWTELSYFGSWWCEKPKSFNVHYTGESLLEAPILASTNPQYDKRLFVGLPVQYIKTTSSEHVVHINCFECQNKTKQFMYICSQLVVFMYWTGKSMNNLLSYYGLVDARISASEKYLPVLPKDPKKMSLAHINILGSLTTSLVIKYTVQFFFFCK